MQIPGGFQAQVNNELAPGVEGDFASTNPFSSVLAGPGALVAPPGGLAVGRFAWVGPQGQVSQSFVAGWQIGFCGRNEQALITQYLGAFTLVIPAGFMVNLFNGGDFWARFPEGGTVGNQIYADPNDGTVLGLNALPSGTATGGFTGTATLVNASPVLTVATATSGILSPGDLITGTSIPSGASILNQLTGSPGGVGTYTMSAAATATVGTAEAVVSHSNFMLVTAVTQTGFTVGDVITGTGVTGGTTITAQAIPFQGVANLATSTALTVTSVQAGTDLLRVGAKVVMNGVPAGTTIASQTSGTPGGVGVYVLSAASTVTQNGVAITTGDTLGGTGFYTITNNQQFTSATVTAAGSAVLTPFTLTGAYSPNPNELGKISAFVT